MSLPQVTLVTVLRSEGIVPVPQARGVSFNRGSPLAVCLAASNWQLGRDPISDSKFIVFLQLQSLDRDRNCELSLLFSFPASNVLF